MESRYRGAAIVLQTVLYRGFAEKEIGKFTVQQCFRSNTRGSARVCELSISTHFKTRSRTFREIVARRQRVSLYRRMNKNGANALLAFAGQGRGSIERNKNITPFYIHTVFRYSCFASTRRARLSIDIRAR